MSGFRDTTIGANEKLVVGGFRSSTIGANDDHGVGGWPYSTFELDYTFEGVQRRATFDYLGKNMHDLLGETTALVVDPKNPQTCFVRDFYT